MNCTTSAAASEGRTKPRRVTREYSPPSALWPPSANVRSLLWLASAFGCLLGMEALYATGAASPTADALFILLAIGGFHASSRHFRLQEEAKNQTKNQTQTQPQEDKKGETAL